MPAPAGRKKVILPPHRQRAVGVRGERLELRYSATLLVIEEQVELDRRFRSGESNAESVYSSAQRAIDRQHHGYIATWWPQASGSRARPRGLGRWAPQ
jgi:hypothetical protein